MTRTKTLVERKGTAPELLMVILEEIRLLRDELGLLLPQDNLGAYVHPNRIKRSYQRAIKRYPPLPAWK